MIRHLATHQINQEGEEETPLKQLSDEQQNELSHLLTMFIITAGLSMRTVENRYLMRLISYIMSLANLHYSPPNRRQLRVLIKEKAMVMKSDLKTRLSKANKISLTTDCWSSTKQHLGYLGITVHFYIDYVLNSISLGVKCITESHSAKNLSEAINQTLKDYQIKDKVVAMVGDNASTMIATAKLLKIEYRSCFAHTLNLVVSRALKTLDFIEIEDKDDDSLDVREPARTKVGTKDLIVRCREMVTLFNQSNLLTQQLLGEQQSQVIRGRRHLRVVLIQDVKTR
jgi:hypothetical protein